MMDTQSDIVLHPQLTPPPSTNHDAEADSDGEIEEQVAPIEPPQTVRVARPVPPHDYGPQASIITVDQLLQLALRYNEQPIKQRGIDFRT